MSINGARRVIKQSWSETSKKTTSLGKLTLAEGSTELTFRDKILDFLASPFAHETGFYFKGRRQYTIQACAGCSVFCIFIIAISFLYLFVPVFTGEIIES